jgi:hypothetical protein
LLAQPVSLELAYGNGKFLFDSIQWELNYGTSHEHPWFQCKLQNETGLIWKEVTFQIIANGYDGHTYVFEATPSMTLGLSTPASETALLVMSPFPSSALPLKSASARLLHGIESRPVAAKLYDGPLVLQKDCIPDFLKASALSGLELRKKFTELVAYGCIKVISDVYVYFFTESSSFPSGPKQHVTFSNVLIKGAFASSEREKDDTGWVRSEQVRDGFREELVAHPN